MRGADPQDAWDTVMGLVRLPKVGPDGNKKEISLSHEIFLRQLEPDVRGQLTYAYTLHDDELLEKAKKLTLSSKAARLAAPRSSVCLATEKGEEEDDDPTQEIGAVTQRKSSHTQRGETSWCHYHRRFGRHSRRCESPCTFQQPIKQRRQRKPKSPVAAASSEPHRFYVRDAISGRRMLVDTGAMHSIFPPVRKRPQPRA
ncbi:uncharacterized protein LOC135206826 [Macrobrachium nipponense]|uniref:uncharacterized protein LOC135206826 n=1 Tax=Macrobrachium nipponense TaxID=159736 RepID=UPI0030C81DF3